MPTDNLIVYQIPEDAHTLRYTKCDDVYKWAESCNIWIGIARGKVYFRREKDLTMFLLRWPLVTSIIQE